MGDVSIDTPPIVACCYHHSLLEEQFELQNKHLLKQTNCIQWLYKIFQSTKAVNIFRLSVMRAAVMGGNYSVVKRGSRVFLSPYIMVKDKEAKASKTKKHLHIEAY